jgi:hypothetical protein
MMERGWATRLSLSVVRLNRRVIGERLYTGETATAG